MRSALIKTTVIASLLSFLFASGLTAQNSLISYLNDPAAVYEEKVIDITHLEVHIAPDTLGKNVSGSAIFTFVPLRPAIDTIFFNAPGIMTHKVLLNGNPVKFSFNRSTLRIYGLPITWNSQTQKLEIAYHSSGSPEPYFTGWDDSTHRMRRQIWAHRPTGWIPFINDRLRTDFYITFNSRYKVYSNGERVSVKANKGNTLTWHYRMNHPHPFFSTALVIGNYDYKNLVTAAGTPLEYWYYPDCEDHFEPTYRNSVEMFSFLEKELGVAYPWELYRQVPVVDYLYGAMETTTSTIFGDYLQIDERGWWGRNYVNVNVHELTHQWFGNYIAHEPASDVWLTESMATYYAKLFEKSIYGQSYYEKEKLNEQQKAFTQAEKDNLPLAHSQAGSFRWYQKGSLVLDMLRDEMGDSLFRKGMTHYLEKFAYSEASSHDFIKALYESTGMSLNWFFDQWLFKGGEPHFEVSFNEISSKTGDWTELHVRQIQPQTSTTGLFRVTIGIGIGYANGSTSRTQLQINSLDTIFLIPNPKHIPVDFLVFDTGNRLLKKLNFPRSLEQLSAEAKRAPSVADRYEALVAMRELPTDLKKDILIECAGLSEEELIYSEVLEQLSADTSETTCVLFTGALKHPDAMIRRSAITNFKMLIPSDTIKVKHLLQDPDYINVELSLRKLCEFIPSQSGYWLNLTSGETGWRGRNIRIAWLEIAIRSGNQEYLAELADYAGPSFEFETRINAIRALDKLSFLDINHAANLVKASTYWNPKLATPARETLKKYYLQKENQALIEEALSLSGLTLKDAGIQ